MSSPFEILRKSVVLYRTNASIIGGYAAWLLLTSAALIASGRIPNEAWSTVLSAIFNVADFVLWMWVSVLVTRVTALASVGGPAPFDVRALSSEAWALLLPTALAGLLAAALMMGGLLLFVVPGLVFTVWFFFSDQAVILEGKRGFDALVASRELVRGRFFAVAWMLFAGPFAALAAYLAALTAIFIIALVATGGTADALLESGAPLWAETLAVILEIFLIPLLYVYWTLVYLELRGTKVVE